MVVGSVVDVVVDVGQVVVCRSKNEGVPKGAVPMGHH